MATAPPTSSAPRWGRSGEPGSAFNGLTRPGRGGRGGRGASRGGRGGGRGGPPFKDEPKLSIPESAPKPSAASPSTPTPTSSSSSKSKSHSRRLSRTIPPAIATQTLPTPDIPPSPLSARPPHRSKRSQASKSIPPKINPPPPNPNLLRTTKPRLPTVAPVKDIPPHLTNSAPQNFDMRHDIDALVERVRAVAMDHHRPTTPGSHIDWAGDDDDSLPDLDDWGVTPATFSSSTTATRPEEDPNIISPLLVGGLKTLPDLVPAASGPASPLRHVVDASPPQAPAEHPDTPELDVNDAPPTPKANALSFNSRPASSASSRRPLHPSLPAKPAVAPPQLKARTGATPMRVPAAYPKTPNSAASPTANDFAAKQIQAMLDQAEEKHAIEGEEEVRGQEGGKEEDAEKAAEEHRQTSEDPPVVVVGSESTAEEASSSTTTATALLTESAIKVTASQPPSLPLKHKDPFLADLAVDGLAASIHAPPRAITDAVSAPAHISTYSDSAADKDRSVSLHGGGVGESMHAVSASATGGGGAHTVGRPAHANGNGNGYNRPASSNAGGRYGEYTPRFTRTGHSTPRGGGSAYQGHHGQQQLLGEGRYHSRTHSSPPTGNGGGGSRSAGVGGGGGHQYQQHQQQHHYHAVRPVITGDAISRLARTIVRTNNPAAAGVNVSPVKSAGVVGE